MMLRLNYTKIFSKIIPKNFYNFKIFIRLIIAIGLSKGVY